MIVEDPWVDIHDVINILNDENWRWPRNSECKYVELRVDTRDMHCVVRDRDSRVLTLKDLSRQVDSYVEPVPMTYIKSSDLKALKDTIAELRLELAEALRLQDRFDPDTYNNNA